MSKNKAPGGKSGTKKIPKRIAGVKIPKGLRDSGNAAVKLAQSPMARELLTAGLAAAAAAVAANARARGQAQQGGADAAKAFTDVADAATKSATEIKAALIEAAGVAAQQFFSGKFAASAETATASELAEENTVAPETGAQPDVPMPSDIDQEPSPSPAPVANGAGTRASRVRAAKPTATPAA